jgi:hypothetical protein
MTKWRSYEEAAAHLLNQFAHEFGLERVEGKQKVVGQHSGTTWEIDAKGIRQGDSGFLIVECRRYTNSKQNQDKIAGLAYRIIAEHHQAAPLPPPPNSVYHSLTHAAGIPQGTETVEVTFPASSARGLRGPDPSTR